MDRENVLSRAVQIIGSQQFAYLSTVDQDDYPATRVVFNLRSSTHYPHVDSSIFDHKNRFVLYFGTNTSSEKVSQIKKNPRISSYYSDLENWEGFLLSGAAEFIDDVNLKKAVWDESWNRYYSLGVEDPDFTLIRMIPSRAEFYGQLSVHKFSREEILGF